MDNQIKASIDNALGTDTRLPIIVPRNALSGGLTVCAFGKCPPSGVANAAVLIAGPDKLASASITGVAYDDSRDGSAAGHVVNKYYQDNRQPL
jgi:hypothetical protein